MKLYFENSIGKRKLIAKPKTEEDVQKEIQEFCDSRNYKIYYTRSWRNKDGLKVFDVGSWTEFFLLDDN